MPRVKQRTPELRSRLLAAAVATLNDEGVARLTTRRVAEQAGTSVPAVYELFDDKAGLVRAIFFEGFRLLDAELSGVPVTDDPVADVEALVPVFRRFCLDYSRLAQVMFSRPFADFDPGPDELAAGEAVRDIFLGRIQRCLDDGRLTGNAVDIAHVLLALAKGLAVQEAGCWLGTTPQSVERRWRLGVRSLLAGFATSAVEVDP
ncbi:TetR family transcriptional regulator [Mycobacterium sp. 852013-51886_SCH5428379]|uniref:TetR/AcrR family transcriptional regulator n=1 Tax=Mycobacterium sp. 852013-51886_SCH5428379 TaxID=1834111 RepID=UPI0007FD6AF7|nr:TetR/AcrR family transcriptional regulator [Mycobacterium sp. 852013-51886_SCH5428379]OBB57151.1 TetR family transcriptional regulator [Mycobacterium sp. 852013-51886_SCH5428379]